MQDALADWRGGRTSWEHWGDSTDAARAAFAELVHVTPADVAIGSTVSGLVGLVAASQPGGTRVLIPEIEFTSTPPARTSTRATSARRCASRATPAASTPPPRGTAGSGRRPRSR